MLSTAFTDFVQSPSETTFPAAWKKLRCSLKRDLCRRRLWFAPPCILGLVAWHSFDDKGALDELAHEAYLVAIQARWISYASRVEEGMEIDGLVVRNLRHFITDRLKKEAHLDTPCHHALKSAIERAVGRGSLHVLAGDEDISFDTIVGFMSATEKPMIAEPEQLLAVIQRWPEYLADFAAQRKRIFDPLLPRLAEAGIEAFHYSDLLVQLQIDLRGRFAAVLSAELDPRNGTLPRITDFIDKEAIKKLFSCARAKLTQKKLRPEMRRHVERLLDYFEELTLEEGSIRLMSDRKLAIELGISRGSLKKARTIARQLIEDCLT